MQGHVYTNNTVVSQKGPMDVHFTLGSNSRVGLTFETLVLHTIKCAKQCK